MSAEAPVLYRVGREPDPFNQPPFDDGKNSGNRFDDPAGEFWVMYAAEQRRACFAETLARFRVDTGLLARLKEMPDGEAGNDIPEAGVIPDDWHLKRMVGVFRVVPGQRWLDLRVAEVLELVRHELATTLVELGRDDFDLSDAMSRDRTLTQQIARWAFEQGYQGIIYKSRLDATFDCWAIFEGAQYERLDATAIAHDDEDLASIAEIYGLHVAE